MGMGSLCELVGSPKIASTSVGDISLWMRSRLAWVSTGEATGGAGAGLGGAGAGEVVTVVVVFVTDSVEGAGPQVTNKTPKPKQAIFFMIERFKASVVVRPKMRG